MKTSGIVLDCRNLGDLYDDSRYHASIVNTNGVIVRGLHGRGVYFNGVDAFLDAGNPSQLNILDAISIEAWVKFDSLTNHDMVISKTVLGTLVGGWGFEYFNGQLRFYIESWSTNVAYKSFTDTTSWHHLVGTYDRNAGTNQINIYINSVVGTPDIYSLAITGTIDNVNIGQGFGGNFSNGNISSVRIYNYALSADDIKLHYRQQAPYYQEAPIICL